MTYVLIFLAYLVIISVVAIIVTVRDKSIARRNENLERKKRRVPERTLLIIAALGGSVAMYITMHKIRHKTKHAKFMWGIPAIIFAQAAIPVAIYFLFLR